MSAPGIAKIVRENDQTVRNWLTRYEAEGIEGLSDAPRPGSPGKVTLLQGPGSMKLGNGAARVPTPCQQASRFVGQYPTPQTLGAPYPRPQRLQLHDLAVIDKQVHLGAVVLDIPSEHCRIGSLKHYFVETQRIDKLSWHVGPP